MGMLVPPPPEPRRERYPTYMQYRDAHDAWQKYWDWYMRAGERQAIMMIVIWLTVMVALAFLAITLLVSKLTVKETPMPNAPKTNNPLEGTAPVHKTKREMVRIRKSTKDYKGPWLKLRRLQLNEEPLCRVCLKAGRTTAATDVDHIVPMSKGGGRLDQTNLQSLCHSCHSRKTASETSRASDGKYTQK